MFPPTLAIAAIFVIPPSEPAVRIEALEKGYQIKLTRPAAERLHTALERADEKSLAELLKDLAQAARENDEDSTTAVTLDVVSVILSSQIPQIRKSLGENIGPHGATIRVWGLVRENILRNPRPRLRQIIEGVKVALPNDARATVDGVMMVARTTPLTWKIEPRE
jgi:hypothetical protein